MLEARHLPGFEILAITASQVKGQMTMSLVVPPVLIGEVGQVLEPAARVGHTRSRQREPIGTDPHDRAPESKTLVLILGMAKALHSLFHHGRLLKGLLPRTTDRVGRVRNADNQARHKRHDPRDGISHLPPPITLKL